MNRETNRYCFPWFTNIFEYRRFIVRPTFMFGSFVLVEHVPHWATQLYPFDFKRLIGVIENLTH